MMNNEPVAWMNPSQVVHGFIDARTYWLEGFIPLYTHPHSDKSVKAKTQLSNGHLSDCAIHNEPASKNKDCDCGFEPKFDLSSLKHEDNCRYFDDELYCSCGADTYALVEWYRHKEVTYPAKTLTMAEMEDFINAYGMDMDDRYEFTFAQLTKMIVEIEHQIKGEK